MKVNDYLSHDYNQTQRAIQMGLVKKWDKSGLLVDLNENQKTTMAVLLENQARQLVKESNQTGTSAGAEEWNGVALPLVRRIFSEIVAKDFVSVQPMNLPSGLVFYLDFKYATGQAGFNTGSGRNSQADSVFGITDSSKGGDAGTEGFYGAGRFGYTINDVSSSNINFGTTPSSTVWASSSISFSDINFNSDFSASTWAPAAADTVIKVSFATASIANFDAEGVRAFTVTSVTGSDIVDTFQEFTTLSGGNINFIVSASSGLAPSASMLRVNYHKQPTDVTRGDFEDGATQAGGFGVDVDIPEINLEMRSEAIVAKTRKLKAIWTPEFAQDLNAYHSIDAEAELTSMLSEYISQEIDFEILGMLIENAQTTGYWDMRIGYEWNGTDGFALTASNVSAYNQGTWFQTLGTKIQDVSNTIHKLTLRGGANFLVTSPKVCTILESIPGYAASTDGDQESFAFGVQKIGSVNGRFKVYKNPYMTENLILMGYKGSQFLETGAVYAPYIPLIMTPLVYDPTNFTPRKGVMTRYAKKIVRPEFYGKIYVSGLNTL